jgi:hypothetical protein
MELFPTFHSQLSLYTLVSDSKYSEHSKSIFIPIGSSSHSNFSHLLFHPNTRECPSVIERLRRLASFPRSKKNLASIDYDKIAYHKVQYLPPSYNGDVIFELPPNHVFASTSKNTMDSMDKRFNGHT